MEAGLNAREINPEAGIGGLKILKKSGNEKAMIYPYRSRNGTTYNIKKNPLDMWGGSPECISYTVNRARFLMVFSA
ncbi:MAG: hypothetical protein NTV68_03065 [Methanomicrobiales archaeon]|nr:hypothetical protein [Methanomicrobiales archaeon]